MAGMGSNPRVGATFVLLMLAFAEPAEEQATSNKLKFLHITDVHLDMKYKAGAEGECWDPPCCREMLASPKKAARTFGEAKCDTPLVLFQSMIDGASTLKPDFVVWTGDSGPHGKDVGRVKDDVLGAIGNITSILRTALPGVPVFPLLGNWDLVPAHTFSPQSDLRWLFDSVLDLWAPWIGPVASEQFSKTGYYDLPLTRGLRLVALNTELCHMKNFHGFIDNSRTMQQLEWLEGVLVRAKGAGEQVLVAGHIPPGLWSGCWAEHGDEYESILSRHAGVVAGQVFGHQHTGSFRMLQHPNTTSEQPFAVAHVTPASTPYNGRNPSFRLYQLAKPGPAPSGGWAVSDFDQYYLDMDVTDEPAPGGQLVWQQGLGGLRSLGLEDLGPANFWRVASHIKTNKTYADLFQNMEANGKPPTGGSESKAAADYACGVNNIASGRFMECSKKSEETLVKQYTGSSHTYVLTAMFPFEVALDHFCPALRGVHPSDCQMIERAVTEI